MMTHTTVFQTVVIGAGSGGLTVAVGLAALGRPVALIEGAAVGGDCTNVGCIPSKTLIHESGSRSGGAAAILATVQRKRDHLRAEETRHVQQMEYLTFIHGWAHFLGPKRLEVIHADGSRREISAQTIVIATGSRARTMEIPGLPRERLLTNESIFELTDAPHHLAIVGAGVIAMELAFAFRKLGSRVTIISRDRRVFARGGAAASEVLAASLREQGIAVRYGATVTRYDPTDETLYLTAGDGADVVLGVDHVLLAIGRVRNIDQLGLEQTGVRFSLDSGVEVDSYGQTNMPGIYAIGDVTPTSHWTHSAGAQGRRVVQRILFPWLPAWGQEPLYPSATFSDPEVASVGLTPDQIARRYHPGLIKTLRVELSATDKGYTEGLRRGFIHVYALRLTGRILGATIVGPRASEMISLFTLAISARISLYRLYRLVYPYPTHSTGIQALADTFVRETLPHLPAELGAVARYGLATIWGRLRGGSFEAVPQPDRKLAGAVGD
ncbi:MAG TPA: NAD(P)/FAD-dependent oxidoreductase [Herpetosiphonaceae bacterium]